MFKNTNENLLFKRKYNKFSLCPYWESTFAFQTATVILHSITEKRTVLQYIDETQWNIYGQNE